MPNKKVNDFNFLHNTFSYLANHAQESGAKLAWGHCPKSCHPALFELGALCDLQGVAVIWQQSVASVWGTPPDTTAINAQQLKIFLRQLWLAVYQELHDQEASRLKQQAYRAIKLRINRLAEDLDLELRIVRKRIEGTKHDKYVFIEAVDNKQDSLTSVKDEVSADTNCLAVTPDFFAERFSRDSAQAKQKSQFRQTKELDRNITLGLSITVAAAEGATIVDSDAAPLQMAEQAASMGIWGAVLNYFLFKPSIYETIRTLRRVFLPDTMAPEREAEVRPPTNRWGVPVAVFLALSTAVCLAALDFVKVLGLSAFMGGGASIVLASVAFVAATAAFSALLFFPMAHFLSHFDPKRMFAEGKDWFLARQDNPLKLIKDLLYEVSKMALTAVAAGVFAYTLTAPLTVLLTGLSIGTAVAAPMAASLATVSAFSFSFFYYRSMNLAFTALTPENLKNTWQELHSALRDSSPARIGFAGTKCVFYVGLVFCLAINTVGQALLVSGFFLFPAVVMVAKGLASFGANAAAAREVTVDEIPRGPATKGDLQAELDISPAYPALSARIPSPTAGPKEEPESPAPTGPSSCVTVVMLSGGYAKGEGPRSPSRYPAQDGENDPQGEGFGLPRKAAVGP